MKIAFIYHFFHSDGIFLLSKLTKINQKLYIYIYIYIYTKMLLLKIKIILDPTVSLATY
ncbi:MAG: hypothetical protein N7Q72_06145 [Spiroplasma sp. Tabriz.8]|nr:hypothetical protein [Spiroplasma sp. Tabriz.8]